MDPVDMYVKLFGPDDKNMGAIGRGLEHARPRSEDRRAVTTLGLWG